jgi:hypothetical protein
MRNKPALLTFVLPLTLAMALSASIASARIPYPPRFVNSPYSVIADKTVTNSFEFTGQAIDWNEDDIVTISTEDVLPPYLFFSSTPGNPATFTFSAPDLTYAPIGPDFVLIFAQDNSPAQNMTITQLGIAIIPEPTHMLLVAGLAVLITRRHI